LNVYVYVRVCVYHPPKCSAQISAQSNLSMQRNDQWYMLLIMETMLLLQSFKICVSWQQTSLPSCKGCTLVLYVLDKIPTCRLGLRWSSPRPCVHRLLQPWQTSAPALWSAPWWSASQSRSWRGLSNKRSVLYRYSHLWYILVLSFSKCIKH